MSFGFSISDIITLTQLITRTYNGWKKACGEYASITGDLAVLQTLLMRVKAEAEAPNSLFSRNPDDLKGWKTLYKSCRSLVAELEEILNKYKSLGTNRRRTWDRIRMGNKNLDSLSRQLVKQTAGISAFVSVLGMSSQGRVENKVFPELLQRMDHIAEQIRNGNASSSTALTTYDNDDKAVWREFRRDMIGVGIRSSDIHKYSAALKTYLSRLQREGLLDEEEPLNNVYTQTPASQSSYPENDSQLPTGESKQIQRNTDDIEYTGDRFTETKGHNLRNTEKELKEAEELGAQVTERVLSLEHPDALSTMHNLASTYRNQKRWKEAEELGVQVMEARKRVLSPEHPDTLSTMHNLASTYRDQKRWKEAEELEVQVMEARKRVLSPEHPDTLSTMHNLASTYRDQKRWKEAEELGVQVMEARKRVLSPEHPDTLSTMHNLASTYRNQKRWKEAEELEVQVMESRKRVLSPEHPDTLSTMHNLASTYRNQKRWKEAEELEVQVMESRKRVLSPEHPDTLSTMHQLASTYRNQKRWKEAEELGVQVMEARKRVLSPEHPATLSTMHNLASTYWDQKRWKETEELEVQVMEARKRVLGPKHPDTLSTMYNLALTFKTQNRDHEAVSLMENCFQLQKQILGPQHPNTELSRKTLSQWAGREHNI
ncbi:MAG: hypothetical protein M1839_003703 [Geoglossum umbratile]|nr:MAG: hypothetical protein M1839_003703 [Geoglossum umbratile]